MVEDLTFDCLTDSGFWVINKNFVRRCIIFKCAMCRRLRGKLETQRMADLPEERTQEAPLFTYCGLDVFGPLTIECCRTKLKRYGIIFTCLASRAVHLEVANTKDINFFIQVLRRFIARQGNMRMLRSDNGTNFVGGQTELSKAFQEMDNERNSSFLQGHGSDWIKLKCNLPVTSQMGGTWERQIRSTRTILADLTKTHGKSSDNESLRTEVQAVIKSRSITVETVSD